MKSDCGLWLLTVNLVGSSFWKESSRLCPRCFWGDAGLLNEFPDSPRPAASMSYLPGVLAVVVGLIELWVGFTLIKLSEFFGRILCKGIDGRL